MNGKKKGKRKRKKRGKDGKKGKKRKKGKERERKAAHIQKHKELRCRIKIRKKKMA